jgi:hypothetical protein
MGSRPHSQRNRIAPGKSASVRGFAWAWSWVDENRPKRSLGCSDRHPFLASWPEPPGCITGKSSVASRSGSEGGQVYEMRLHGHVESPPQRRVVNTAAFFGTDPPIQCFCGPRRKFMSGMGEALAPQFTSKSQYDERFSPTLRERSAAR